jgi:predicted nucleic acid-binding protein
MSGEFIDTNVLVYADDTRDPRKQRKARELIRRLLLEQRGVLSLQVLQEFFAAATRKLGLSSEAARRRVVLYSRFDVIALSQHDLIAAIDLHRLHQVSIWDALILRAALNANCRVLHTEDMQTGALFDTVTLSNPFAS